MEEVRGREGMAFIARRDSRGMRLRLILMSVGALVLISSIPILSEAANTGFPYVIGIASGIDSTATSHTISIPESIVSSLYLVCLVENSGIMITWPTGW